LLQGFVGQVVVADPFPQAEKIGAGYFQAGVLLRESRGQVDGMFLGGCGGQVDRLSGR